MRRDESATCTEPLTCSLETIPHRDRRHRPSGEVAKYLWATGGLSTNRHHRNCVNFVRLFACRENSPGAACGPRAARGRVGNRALCVRKTQRPVAGGRGGCLRYQKPGRASGTQVFSPRPPGAGWGERCRNSVLQLAYPRAARGRPRREEAAVEAGVGRRAASRATNIDSSSEPSCLAAGLRPRPSGRVACRVERFAPLSPRGWGDSLHLRPPGWGDSLHLGFPTGAIRTTRFGGYPKKFATAESAMRRALAAGAGRASPGNLRRKCGLWPQPGRQRSLAARW